MGLKIKAAMALGGMFVSYMFGLNFLSGVATHVDTTGNILGRGDNSQRERYGEREREREGEREKEREGERAGERGRERAGEKGREKGERVCAN